MKRRRGAAAGRGKHRAPLAGRSGPGGAKDARVERAKNLATTVAMAWPLAAFLVLAAAADRASFDATSSQDGMDWPGDLRRALIQAAIETVVLLLILRPWSFRDSVGRLVLALALFVPWTVYTLRINAHAGPILLAHWSWLVFVCVGLVWGLVAVAGARSKQPPSGSRAHG